MDIKRRDRSLAEPLTASGEHSGDARTRSGSRTYRVIVRNRKKFCSDRCRWDSQVLRLAKAMIAEVGIVEFELVESREIIRRSALIAQRTGGLLVKGLRSGSQTS
jgi:hypothetical protein